MATFLIRDKQYVIFFRNGVTKEQNWARNWVDAPVQRKGYFRKIKEFLLYFPERDSRWDTGRPSFIDFCHIIGLDIEHETVNRILINDIDPWICFTEDNDIVFYFGKDKPVKKYKTYKKVGKHVRFWQKWYNWGKPGQDTYYYWDVKHPEKLAVASHHHNIIDAFPELHDKNNHNIPYTIDLSTVEPFKASDEYEFAADKLRELQKQEEEKKRKEEEARIELEKRKATPGNCSRCGAPNADYVANPYQLEMNGTIHMEWLCHDCYESIKGDI